jgi:type VI secretion system protein ImpH
VNPDVGAVTMQPPAAQLPRPRAPVRYSDEPTVADRLFREPFAFDFFQAVRLLERLHPERIAIGREAAPGAEVVRLRAHLSLNFPPSSIYDLTAPADAKLPPLMTVVFLGLTGPSGVLPRHYTELLLRLQREGKGEQRRLLRDWLDLFNHRLISLFYRAWEKYRFYIPYERGEYREPAPDIFTRSVFSLVGMGTPALRGRLRVSVREIEEEREQEKALARVEDLALLYYSGLLAHRPRNAVGLEALLHDYFQLPIRVEQFRGQWLRLEPDSRSLMGMANSQLGMNVVAGERVWDVQGKFRIRLGPLTYAGFLEFLPDQSAISQRKGLYLMRHLVRLYAGPEFDFDVQVVLQATAVPVCQLTKGEGVELGPRLGWNTWIRTRAMSRDADDAVFTGSELVWLDRAAPVTL